MSNLKCVPVSSNLVQILVWVKLLLRRTKDLELLLPEPREMTPGDNSGPLIRRAEQFFPDTTIRENLHLDARLSHSFIGNTVPLLTRRFEWKDVAMMDERGAERRLASAPGRSGAGQGGGTSAVQNHGARHIRCRLASAVSISSQDVVLPRPTNGGKNAYPDEMGPFVLRKGSRAQGL